MTGITRRPRYKLPKGKAKQNRVQVFVDDKTYTILSQLADQNEVSLSTQARDMLEQFIRREVA